MTTQERIDIILKSKIKGHVIHGRYIDLHPYELEHGEIIVRLRNQEKSRYYLNQKQPSTLDGQNKWYEDYALRNNDVYWCIFNKLGTAIGVIRLYDIAPDGSFCEEGSFIIDEAYKMSGPYCLEAKILVFDFAFDVLQVKKVKNEIRIDNKNMNSIDRRMGFRFLKEYERNGAGFYLCELTMTDYKRDKLLEIMGKWRERE